MPKKYAKMIIHIPIEIYENGDYKIFEDRTFMKVEPCTELPPVCISNRDSVLDVLTDMLLPQERIKWGDSSFYKKKEDEDEDFEEDDADTKDEDETDSGEEETQEEEKQEEEPEPEPEIRIYADEIKPKKRTSSAIMSFKKRIRLKDNFTRKSGHSVISMVPRLLRQPLLSRGCLDG
jgi:hypothetical protein